MCNILTTRDHKVAEIALDALNNILRVGVGSPTATGDNPVYINNAPTTVVNLVQTFYNTQKKLAKVCYYVADELKTLNIKEANPRLHGIDQLTKRLRIILESNQDAYQSRPGMNFTLLDLKLGNIYPGIESL